MVRNKEFGENICLNAVGILTNVEKNANLPKAYSAGWLRKITSIITDGNKILTMNPKIT